LNKTKIVSTLGPASSARADVIKKMYEAGLSGVRINTAYGAIAQYNRTVEVIRKIGEIPIILDVKGPEIRINAERMVVDRG
jgi:pyruvate kinase